MKKNAALYFSVLVITLLFSGFSLIKWGFFAHKKINRYAVFTLPEPLFGFYRTHIEVITARAVNPDMRRHLVVGEPPKHYIDLDHYCEDRNAVFDSVPLYWKKAVEKYTEDTLKAYGIVPWVVNWQFYKLKDAFKAHDWEQAIRISADLGHYVADAHVPLHTTKNYNGQLTNQKGIHAFWESRLPELFFDEYDLFVGKSSYVENVQTYIWKSIKESHAAVDSVFMQEKILSEQYEGMKYAYEPRGKNIVKTYSLPYSTAYNKALGGMVERRIRKSVVVLGSIWYTAWVDAGQPNLPNKYKIPILATDSMEQQSPNIKKGRMHE